MWAIELTDEEDATFNHYFVVSEFEYSEFAKEKGFLCDFRAFGEKIVQDLLKPVGASQTDATTDSSSSRPNEYVARTGTPLTYYAHHISQHHVIFMWGLQGVSVFDD